MWGFTIRRAVKLFLTNQSKQNPNSNDAAATDYKGSRDVHVLPGCNLNGLDTIHDPNAKKGVAAPRQILEVQLFRQSPLIFDVFGHGTNSIKKVVSIHFEAIQERPNWMSYATWASILIWTAPG
jgi:hypothetical protein